jgi:CheY-like chemotaxis protein
MPGRHHPPGMARVLVADDVDTLRMLVRLTLEPEFAVVGEAADGVEALRLARELEPDVVVLDLNMPGLDGLQVLEALQAELPATRVVVLSGLAPDLVAGQALDLGAVRFVEKGRPLDELRDVLRAVVGPQA